MKARAQDQSAVRAGPGDRAKCEGPRNAARSFTCDLPEDQAFTVSFSAFAMVTLTTLSAGLVIISWVCGLRT